MMIVTARMKWEENLVMRKGEDDEEAESSSGNKEDNSEAVEPME
jgi:hypothetical protein